MYICNNWQAFQNKYCNVPKFSDRQVWANSVNPGQIAPRGGWSWVWSGSTLFAIPSALFEPRHDKTNKMSVRQAKTQISLGIRTVWSESSLCAKWVAEGPRFLHVDSEDSDQTGRMPRLIWVFGGRTLIFVCFVMSRLIWTHYFIAYSRCSIFRVITAMFSGVRNF